MNSTIGRTRPAALQRERTRPRLTIAAQRLTAAQSATYCTAVGTYKQGQPLAEHE